MSTAHFMEETIQDTMQEDLVRRIESIMDEYLYVDENTGKLRSYNWENTRDIAVDVVNMLKEKRLI